MMRTTIDLPADLHHIVTSVALHTRRSMNQTVADLIRRGLEVPSPDGDVAGERPGHGLQFSDRTGLPVIRSPHPVTPEDVRALDDDE